MKKIDLTTIEPRIGLGYPEPHGEPCKTRKAWALSRHWGLKQFGVHRVELPPGAWSTQRHWHKANDELVVVLEGEVVLVTDDGEEILRAGDCAGFRAGEANGHHLQNRSAEPAAFLDVGGREPFDVVEFSDIDMRAVGRFEIQFQPKKKAER